MTFLWSIGALYYDAGKGNKPGLVLAGIWILLILALVVMTDSVFVLFSAYTLFFVLLFCWWVSQKPSNHHEWDSNFSKLPVIKSNGNELIIENVRHTRYRSLDDYDARFETRAFQINKLTGVDIAILYWGSNLMSHPMLIFEFSDQERICFSIEVRYRANQRYDFLKSIYRQNELMYVVCDERDAILRRTKYSAGHEIYLYRLQIDRTHAQEILDEYIDQTNQLVEFPKWYNSITNNCTTAIYRQRNGKMPWDIRILLNGAMDKMLYDWKRLTQALPFDELKAQSKINDRANSADYDRFGEQIRQGLPGFEHSANG